MLRKLHTMRFHREHRWTHKRLSEYIDGNLDPRRRHRVERHVRVCPECRRVLATLKRTLAGLVGLREDQAGDIADSVIARLRVEADG